MRKFTIYWCLLIVSALLGMKSVMGQAGVMDCDFGTGGVVTTPFTVGTEDTAYDLVVYNGEASGAYDDKIIVVGTDENLSGTNNFAVARYQSDGTLDTSFGTGGKVTIDFGHDGERAYGVALQDDGKIIVSGTSGNPSYCAIARLNADGSLDSSFSGDGKNRTAEGYWNDVAIDSNGNIFVAGSGSNTSNVLKFSSSGGLLNNFSYDLTSGTTCCEGFNAIAIDSSDRIVVVGGSQQSSRDMSVIRINSNGTLDSSFDGDGKKFIDFNNDWDVAGSIAINSDGRMAIAGEAPSGDFGIALLNSDGSFDTGFGGGKVSVDLDGGTSDQSNSGVFFQPDGKIIGGCYASGQYGMVRYNSDGSLDTSFSDDGKALFYTGASGGDYPNSFYLAPNGDFLGCGIAWVQSGDDGKDFGIVSVRTQSENMVYNSISTIQESAIIPPGSLGTVIGVKIDVCGDLQAKNVTQIDFSTNGSSNVSDIQDARIYYTGTSNAFDTSNQFGTTVSSPNGSHSVTASQGLEHGTNYFWIAYNVKAGATQGNVVDAQCSQVTIDGGVGTVVPDVTDPAGSREIKSVIFEEDFGSDESALPSGWTIQDVDGDGYNWTTTNDPNGGAVNGRTGGGVRSASWEGTERAPVDNRLISPEIDLVGYSAASLAFYLASVDIWGGYENEHVEVYISDSWDGTSNFPLTNLLGALTTTTVGWTEFSMNLDDYAGSTVHLSWVHKMTDTSASWGLRMDDVLATGVPQAQPGMLIKQDVTDIASGGSFDFGSAVSESPTDVVFSIENNGSGSLSFSGAPMVSISGADALDFSVVYQPASSVPAGGTTSFTLQFAPSATGDKSATVSVENNSETTPYTFTISGTGWAISEVTTQAVDQITATSASGNGTISNLGYPNPTQHGFVWNTSGTPSLSDSKTELGGTLVSGDFSSSIVGLDPGTTYYVRAYASNEAGTAYGDEVSFETPQKVLTLTGGFSVNNKTYDGEKSAEMDVNSLILDGVETGDDVSIENVALEFVEATAGTNVDVQVIRADLTGADAYKYSLSLSGAPNGSASISAKELTLEGTFLVSDKEYDGNTNATINSNEITLSGIITGDDVTLGSVTASFSSSDPGTDISVDITEAFLTGSQTGNYTVSLVGAPTALASIFAPQYTVTIEVQDGNGNPVSGADVEIASQNLVTNAMGIVFIDLEDGVYSLVVSHEGVEKYSDNVTVSGTNQQVDVVIAATSVYGYMDSEVMLFPMPFDEKLNVKGSDNLRKITFLDVSGQEVKNIQDPEARIRTGDLKPGIYLIKLFYLNDKIEVRKIIKK